MKSIGLEIRSYITIFSLVFLISFLSGCQTTDTVVIAKPIEISDPKKEESKQKDPEEVPTVFQTAKPVICAPPDVIKKGLNSSTEKVFAMWKSLLKEYPVVMFVDSKQKTLTILEYIGNGYACFLSVGKNVDILDFPVSTNGNGIKANYKLWK